MLPFDTPVALTIAGSDSGGEAGIQADLRVFADFHVHGVTAVTCLTAQNPRKISRLEPCSPKMLRAQLDAILARYSPGAAKTGMLYSAAHVSECARFFRFNQKIPLVVDPVIVSTSGRRLLDKAGLKTLRDQLLPLAGIVTPNVGEAEVLLDTTIRSIEELRAAAAAIHRKFGCAALVKGGHLGRSTPAVDFFHGREGEWMLSSARIAGATLHGTGCAYSAAVAAGLACGKSRIKAIESAKNYITQRIAQTLRPAS